MLRAEYMKQLLRREEQAPFLRHHDTSSCIENSSIVTLDNKEYRILESPMD